MLLKQSPSAPKDVRVYAQQRWRLEQPSCRAHTALGAALRQGKELNTSQEAGAQAGAAIASA